MNRCALLHIEDEDASACLVRYALEEAQIPVNVYRVCNGEEGLLFLQKQAPYEIARTPNLVLLDLNMPRVDGWSVLQNMQQAPSLREIPVVVLTASPSAKDQERAEKLGARRFMTKPSSFDSLVEGMKSICRDFLDAAPSAVEGS
jgi:CheY-like chemotaxis protein